ncbi:branched-chain amino acid ABC transporter permease [Bradyrhizobium sp. Arg237L]|uniref:branched-chain amino acid ABC transporter permease n=1 Tax=Bradyrhizobium sp. Arg237L TaxID=3003352 RepID=UPI00249E1BD3|nr:branched-chain amino acid ABC transporter permease [Bradyrhizobium sp. Arg237L]MDI4237141.1 branched-chain amino acid ABC transporter permease [Bradyrhizobium sp. Arg237L]
MSLSGRSYPRNDSVSTLSAVVVDAASFAAWLFLVAVGLTLVFGVLRLLNIAHGAFYSVGAYAAVYAIGASVTLGWATWIQLVAALAAAVAIGAVIGLLTERCILGRLYGYPEPLVLIATYALFLILDDATKLVSGGGSLYAAQPRDSLGQIGIGGLQYPVYDVALIGVSMMLAAIVWFVLNRTRVGRCVTAVVFDSEISAAMGIHVGRIKTATFMVGAALGCLAGALTAPKIAVSPGMGVEVIVIAFAVVVVGGLGSIPGALLGAAIIGLARALTAHLLPELEIFAVYLVMAGVLAVRPFGLLSPAQVRRI